jgi:hypothetical protein
MKQLLLVNNNLIPGNCFAVFEGKNELTLVSQETHAFHRKDIMLMWINKEIATKLIPILQEYVTKES